VEYISRVVENENNKSFTRKIVDLFM
jgi:hypothetical protein